MIPQAKLQELTIESDGVPGLADINAALRELQWRRLHQGKLDKKLHKLKVHIDEVRPQKRGKLRVLMERLKF